MSKTRSAREISRLLRREVIPSWGTCSVHEIGKRHVIDLVTEVSGRGTPSAANKLHKVVKAFFGWCVGRAVLDVSPAKELAAPARERPRDRVLNDDELARIIKAARQVDGPYAGIVELLALTGQRREEVAQLTWDQVDVANQTWTLPTSRTKNGRRHIVHLSKEAIAVLMRTPEPGRFVFSLTGTKPFQSFSAAKRELDKLSSVSSWRLHDLRRTFVYGMARLGVAPHVADKVLNHQSGTISGVAAVYQRHEFLTERKDALERWGAHVGRLLQSREIKVA